MSLHLGLEETDIEAIEHKAQRNVELMRLYALKKWKSIFQVDGTATYRVLLKALLKCGCTELALKVCELLKGEDLNNCT